MCIRASLLIYSTYILAGFVELAMYAHTFYLFFLACEKNIYIKNELEKLQIERHNKKQIQLMCFISNVISHAFMILSLACSSFDVYAKLKFVSIWKKK